MKIIDMQKIQIGKKLASLVPELKLACIECDVEVKIDDRNLWQQIEAKVIELNSELKVEYISKLATIASSRKAYKACGKDPARYRLSAEALLRRVLQRKEIYQVNNVVDVLNLVSISTGFSIGGYDADKISGDIEFGIGDNNEPYKGIGRGELNIEFMPVFRDDSGAFGSPTSDSVRTCVTPETKRFLMVIIDFGTNNLLPLATEMAKSLLVKYASATNFLVETVKSK